MADTPAVYFCPRYQHAYWGTSIYLAVAAHSLGYVGNFEKPLLVIYKPTSSGHTRQIDAADAIMMINKEFLLPIRPVVQVHMGERQPHNWAPPPARRVATMHRTANGLASSTGHGDSPSRDRASVSTLEMERSRFMFPGFSGPHLTGSPSSGTSCTGRRPARCPAPVISPYALVVPVSGAPQLGQCAVSL